MHMHPTMRAVVGQQRWAVHVMRLPILPHVKQPVCLVLHAGSIESGPSELWSRSDETQHNFSDLLSTVMAEKVANQTVSRAKRPLFLDNAAILRRRAVQQMQQRKCRRCTETTDVIDCDLALGRLMRVFTFRCVVLCPRCRRCEVCGSGELTDVCDMSAEGEQLLAHICCVKCANFCGHCLRFVHPSNTQPAHPATADEVCKNCCCGCGLNMRPLFSHATGRLYCASCVMTRRVYKDLTDQDGPDVADTPEWQALVARVMASE